MVFPREQTFERSDGDQLKNMNNWNVVITLRIHPPLAEVNCDSQKGDDFRDKDENPLFSTIGRVEFQRLSFPGRHCQLRADDKVSPTLLNKNYFSLICGSKLCLQVLPYFLT